MRVVEHTIDLAGCPAFYRRAPRTESTTAPATRPAADDEPATPSPPPLYLHGVPTSSDDWVEMQERLGGIAPDLIGFGRSGKGGHLDYSLGGLTEFLERFLDNLDVPAVDVVGHDWGAAVGVLFAHRHPDRVRRMVLLNPLTLIDGFRWHRLARLWRRPLVGELVMGATSRWMLSRALRRGAAAPGAWPRGRTDAVWRQFDQGTQRAILRLHRSTDQALVSAMAAALRSLEGPVLVVWGERDPWRSPQLAERFAAHLPCARLEMLTGAGHWPWLDQPDVIDRVAEFLRDAPR